jgi:sensor domain CHASE-containing protein
MIKLFRNIRKNLLNQGKTSKYFKYAIGEIVLVVIGILIALQINDRNEQKKLKQQEVTSYCKLQEDLTADISNIDKTLLSLSKRQATAKHF